MRKDNVIPLDKDWHIKFATKKTVEAKANKALDMVEKYEAMKLATRPKRIVPSFGWASPSEKLYTIEEVAHHFVVDAVTIKRAVKRGELIAEHCGKDGNILRFSRASIDAYKTLLSKKRYG